MAFYRSCNSYTYTCVCISTRVYPDVYVYLVNYTLNYFKRTVELFTESGDFKLAINLYEIN